MTTTTTTTTTPKPTTTTRTEKTTIRPRTTRPTIRTTMPYADEDYDDYNEIEDESDSSTKRNGRDETMTTTKRTVTINYDGDYETVDDHRKKLNATDKDQLPTIPDICQGQFDAVSILRNELFFFKDQVFEFHYLFPLEFILNRSCLVCLAPTSESRHRIWISDSYPPPFPRTSTVVTSSGRTLRAS